MGVRDSSNSLSAETRTWLVGLKGVKDISNSLSTEPKVHLVSMLERVPGTATAYKLQR
jgi:hypothetical protein